MVEDDPSIARDPDVLPAFAGDGGPTAMITRSIGDPSAGVIGGGLVVATNGSAALQTCDTAIKRMGLSSAASVRQ